MKVLILFGHPAFQNSTVNKYIIQGLERKPDVTFHDLYEAYPEMDIDIDFEQRLLLEHDVIVFHHPMYWYSSPAIFKEWQDLVLEHGWAYGHEGHALKGKFFFSCITTGAPKNAFIKGDLQNHTVNEFLIPFKQMALRCNMITLPPLVIHGTHLITQERLDHFRQQYHAILDKIIEGNLNTVKICRLEYLNDILKMEA